MNFKHILILVIIFASSMPVSVYGISKESEQLYKEAHALVETDSIVMSKERHELGIKKFEEAIKLDPNYYDAYVGLAKAYRDYGIVYVRGTEHLAEQEAYVKKAANIIAKAISVAPDRPEAYHIYLMTLSDEQASFEAKGLEFSVQQKQEMREVKKKLYQLDPNNPDVLIMKGYDFIDEGKIKEGIDYVLKGADDSPGEGWVAAGEKERLAEHLKEGGYEKEAAEVTDSIKKVEKFYRGVGEIDQGNAEKGFKMVKEATKGDYANLSLKQKDYFAKILENKKMYKESADIYELMDRDKYNEKIKELRGKGKTK